MFQRKGCRYLPGLTIRNVASAVLQLGQVIEHLGDVTTPSANRRPMHGVLDALGSDYWVANEV